jgi:hypothetical protein
MSRQAFTLIQATPGIRPNDQPPEEWMVAQAGHRHGTLAGFVAPGDPDGPRMRVDAIQRAREPLGRRTTPAAIEAGCQLPQRRYDNDSKEVLTGTVQWPMIRFVQFANYGSFVPETRSKAEPRIFSI